MKKLDICGLVAAAAIMAWAVGGVEKVGALLNAARLSANKMFTSAKSDGFVADEARAALQSNWQQLDAAYATLDARKASYDKRAEQIKSMDARLADLLKVEAGLRRDIAAASANASGVVLVAGKPRSLTDLNNTLNLAVQEIANLKAAGAGGPGKATLDLQAQQLATAHANLAKQAKTLRELKDRIEQAHASAADARSQKELAQAMSALAGLDLASGSPLHDSLTELDGRARSMVAAAERLNADLASQAASKINGADLAHYASQQPPADPAPSNSPAEPETGGSLTRR